MRRSLSFVILGAGALGGALLFPSTSHAQRMVPGEDAWWASQPGAYVPFNAAPFAERYANPAPSYFLFGEPARQFWAVYEIDRQERLEKFGTRYTPEHPPLFNRILDRRR
ncbi:MAG TPA: hypothetical protein VKA46_22640 [Gemmataceae bacterium]|nr:hypothetical protein [Gemmataceae bacterium]